MAPQREGAQIFAAALRGLESRVSPPMFVDPRPIRITDQIALPDTTDYYPFAANIMRERAAVLRELGIETVRAFPLREGCTGLLVLPPYKRTYGCPEDYRYEAAFDMVRPGKTANEWLLRMISIEYESGGRGATTFQLTIAARKGEFVLERMVVLVVFD